MRICTGASLNNHSACLFVFLFVFLYNCLIVCLFIYISIISTYLSIYLSIFFERCILKAVSMIYIWYVIDRHVSKFYYIISLHNTFSFQFSWCSIIALVTMYNVTSHSYSVRNVRSVSSERSEFCTSQLVWSKLMSYDIAQFYHIIL